MKELLFSALVERVDEKYWVKVELTADSELQFNNIYDTRAEAMNAIFEFLKDHYGN